MNDAARMDDAALLARLHAGDGGAFDPLYQRHQGRIYRYALRMTGSPETAEDVVQEVFLALIRGARGFDAAHGSLAGYLYGMARNLLFRTAGPPPPDELDEASAVVDEDPLEGLDQARRVERVRQALAGLPAHYREAVVLCDLEELSYAEVAEMLGVAVGTVRSRLNRARAMLTERLSGMRSEKERCRA
jgi:RNA polymerase sigma-70 factor (ECF subfamily)